MILIAKNLSSWFAIKCNYTDYIAKFVKLWIYHTIAIILSKKKSKTHFELTAWMCRLICPIVAHIQ